MTSAAWASTLLAHLAVNRAVASLPGWSWRSFSVHPRQALRPPSAPHLPPPPPARCLPFCTPAPIVHRHSPLSALLEPPTASTTHQLPRQKSNDSSAAFAPTCLSPSRRQALYHENYTFQLNDHRTIYHSVTVTLVTLTEPCLPHLGRRAPFGHGPHRRLSSAHELVKAQAGTTRIFPLSYSVR